MPKFRHARFAENVEIRVIGLTCSARIYPGGLTPGALTGYTGNKGNCITYGISVKKLKTFKFIFLCVAEDI